MAFELVQVIDEGYASCINDKVSLESLLYEKYYNLPTSVRSRLKPIMGNALIGVWFKSSASRRARELTVLAIISRVQQITTTTEIEPSLTPNLRKNVKQIRISRGDFVGPSFNICAVTSFADPVIDNVRQKFTKTYTNSIPIELLAFYELQRPSPQDLWLPGLSEFVIMNLDVSPFSRVWVYDVVQQKVKFVHPAIKKLGTYK